MRKSKIQKIADYRGLGQVTRGTVIRSSRSMLEGVIVSTRKGRYHALMVDGNCCIFRPFELDYFVDDRWVLGKDCQAKFQARIDAANARAKGRREQGRR